MRRTTDQRRTHAAPLDVAAGRAVEVTRDVVIGIAHALDPEVRVALVALVALAPALHVAVAGALDEIKDAVAAAAGSVHPERNARAKVALARLQRRRENEAHRLSVQSVQSSVNSWNSRETTVQSSWAN